jgi:hypothetical protein
MLSCAGNKWLQTPALDKLAASGVRFEKAYVANPVCMPSRFSIQTGMLPSAVGIRANDISITNQTCPLLKIYTIGPWEVHSKMPVTIHIMVVSSMFRWRIYDKVIEGLKTKLLAYLAANHIPVILPPEVAQGE